jgi:hypothetical protein
VSVSGTAVWRPTETQPDWKVSAIWHYVIVEGEIVSIDRERLPELGGILRASEERVDREGAF